MSNIKKISAKFALDKGLLFRTNQQVFHPFGLALEVHVDENIKDELKALDDAIEHCDHMACKMEEGDVESIDGGRKCIDQHIQLRNWLKQLRDIKSDGVWFGKLWDYREDRDGMSFADETFEDGRAKFVEFMNDYGMEKLKQRKEVLGYIIQGDNRDDDEEEDEIVTGGFVTKEEAFSDMQDAIYACNECSTVVKPDYESCPGCGISFIDEEK